MREPAGNHQGRTVALRGRGGDLMMGVRLSATREDVVCKVIEGRGALGVSHVTVT